MRKFEKISKSEFLKDVPDANYDDIILPKRSTLNSAGYDFYSVISFTLSPGERRVIPTGIKVSMNSNEFLSIYIRSSLGFKWNIRMCNQVGIIDADYYNNSENEGHIFVCLMNEGNKVLEIKKGDRIVQGIFMPFLITDDDKTTDIRMGGIGSTNKGDDNNE
jgi:dUTP pyrophosphatase